MPTNSSQPIVDALHTPAYHDHTKLVTLTRIDTFMNRILRNIVPLIAGIILIIALAYISIAWYFSNQIIVFQSVPIAESVANSPNESADPDYRDLARFTPPFDVPNIETDSVVVNDVTLVYDFYENETFADCAIVFVHGLSGSRESVSLYAPMFYELGCNVLAYDARAHNDSSDAYLTFGYYEREEVAAMVDIVAERSSIPTEQVGVVGISYGAASALQMLAVRSDVAFIVSDSAFSDMRTIVSQQAKNIFGDAINIITPAALGLAEVRANFDLETTSSLEAIRANTVPVLLLHSEDDSYTLPSHAQAIYAAANPEITRLVYQDYGSVHAESIVDNPEGVRADVYQFLADYAPDFGNQQPTS